MSKSANQPLQTKLFVPPARLALVHRPRLLARLDAGAQQALTLLSAPPGFGKTTLLAEWAAQTSLPLAWVSLDAGENDLARVMACLLAALARLERVDPETLALAQAADSLPPLTLLEALLGDLESVPGPLTLVLDDYHVVHAQAVHDLLAFLLDHQPAPLRLVIATRSDPPIALARLRGRGQMLELRAEELRFNREEAAQFLGQVMGLALQPEEIAVLEARTEGWIAGLQLAALSMQGRKDVAGFIQAFSGSHRYILDYLVEEVINRQPEAIQQFLLQTSILDQLSGPLCDAVNQTHFTGQAILETLERSNLFTIPLDDERGWYRYHHLFADLLRGRLQQTSPALVPELHLRAAAWLDQNGYPVEAIQHALAARDFERAAELIQRHGHERWSFSDVTFMGLLSQIPPAMLHTRPTLGIYQAWMFIVYGRLDAAEELLRGLVQYLPENGGAEVEGIRGFSEILFAYIATLTGKTKAIHLPGRQVLDFISEQFLAMRNSADVVFARLLAYEGRLDEAAEILLNTARRDAAADGTTAIPICIAILARLYMIQGRLLAASILCREYLNLIAERGKRRFYIAGNLDIALSEVLLEWNDLVQAEAAARAGIQANEAWRIPHATAIGWTALAQVQLAQGDLGGASESLKQVDAAIAGRTTPPDQSDEIAVLRLKLDLARGAAPDSRAWRGRLPAEFVPAYRWEQDYILLAGLLLGEQKYSEALGLLEQLQLQAAAGKRAGRLAQILLLKSQALFALGQQPEAFAALQACVEIAGPESHLRLFLAGGEPVRELLAAFGRSQAGGPVDFVRRVLAAFPPPAAAAGTAPAQPGLVEPLTRRELEVLHCLEAGDSNQEIASKLVISLSAVKKHTGNIYGKLGVSSRTQALARARQLGLLPKES